MRSLWYLCHIMTGAACLISLLDEGLLVASVWLLRMIVTKSIGASNSTGPPKTRLSLEDKTVVLLETTERSALHITEVDDRQVVLHRINLVKVDAACRQKSNRLMDWMHLDGFECESFFVELTRQHPSDIYNGMRIGVH